MRVFVAGATGAIGRPLVRQLLAAGHAVSAITRSEERADDLWQQGVDALVGNALDEQRLSEVVRTIHPEVLIHELTTFPTTLQPLRVLRDYRHTARLRVKGAQSFMELARQLGIKRVVAQSIAFGYEPRATAHLATEEDPFYGRGMRPIDFFLSHVQRLEATVTGDRDVEGVALRYGGFYGPGTHFAPNGLFHRLALKRRLPVFQGTTGAWNSIHVDDAASATVAAISGPTGVFNVVDDDPLRYSEFVRLYCDSIAAPTPPTWPRLTTLLTGFCARHLLLHQVAVSNTKAKNQLDWKLRYPTIRDGVESLGP